AALVQAEVALAGEIVDHPLEHSHVGEPACDLHRRVRAEAVDDHDVGRPGELPQGPFDVRLLVAGEDYGRDAIEHRYASSICSATRGQVTRDSTSARPRRPISIRRSGSLSRSSIASNPMAPAPAVTTVFARPTSGERTTGVSTERASRTALPKFSE